MDLTTAPASGSQGTTQNPQTVPSGRAISGASTQSSGVQPGTASDVLTSQNGLSLSNSPLTTVSLDNASAETGSTVAAAPAAPKAEHHVNAVFLMAAAVLVVAAMAFFWTINRSAKNTTD